MVGHSLGAGAAAILTHLLIENRDAVGGISANLIHCYVFSPPRIMSLDLAIKYSSNVHSVIYQVRHTLYTFTKDTSMLVLTKTLGQKLMQDINSNRGRGASHVDYELVDSYVDGLHFCD